MDYRAIAQSILTNLPTPDQEPIQRSRQTDDERIAAIAWTRMKLMHAEQASGGVRYMSLI
ncbi:MAG: hypothetical protein VKK04_08020 [Synechococcales bacterium]|nr:hypothetical protein [Synechococcales bacterium]